jgi:hypothetical protein
MLHIVEAACQFTQDYASGVVVLESDITDHFPSAIEELGTTEARNMSLGFAAQKGCPDPRINGQTAGAYPINVEGLPLEQVRGEDGQALPPQHPRMQVARYRIDIPVCRRLV